MAFELKVGDGDSIRNREITRDFATASFTPPNTFEFSYHTIIRDETLIIQDMTMEDIQLRHYRSLRRSKICRRLGSLSINGFVKVLTAGVHKAKTAPLQHG
jgi:hypothetical protein